MEAKFEQLITAVQQNLAELEVVVTGTTVGVLGDRAAQDVLASMVKQTTAVLQRAELVQSRITGKILQQGAPDLGVASLSARFGHRKVSAFLSDLTKSSYQEADRWVQNGQLYAHSNKLVEAEELGIPLDADDHKHSAQLPILKALDEGRLTPAQASEISKIVEKAPEHLDASAQEDFTRELIDTGEGLEVGSIRKHGQKRLLDLTASTPLEREEQLRSRRTIYFGSRLMVYGRFMVWLIPSLKRF